MTQKFSTVEEYFDAMPPATRAVLEDIRRTIHEVVPDGTDVIAYNIATVKVEGRSLVHYAGWVSHVSLYPAPDGDEDLARDLAPYAAGKGTLRFPLSRPLPRDLVARVVARLAEQRA